MTRRAVVLLSAVALSCAASIQNPHIHDSIEDQIAMESGATQSVVAPPAHIAKTTPSSTRSTATTTTSKPTTPQQKKTKTTPETDDLFEIISPGDNEADAELHPSTPSRRPPARPLPPQSSFQQRRPPFSSFSSRPASLWGQQGGFPSWQQPQQQQPWGQRPAGGLQVLQLPPRYSIGGLNLAGALGSFGGGSRTVILLQPIYMPVRVRAPADDDQALAADSSQEDINKYVREEAARRPVSLMDILQQPFYF